MPANGSKPKKSGDPRKRAVAAGQPAQAPQMAAKPPVGATPDRYAPTAWGNQDVELKLPSGQLCLVRRIPLTVLVQEGIIDNFDSLSALVDEQHVSKKSKLDGPPAKAEIDAEALSRQLMSNPEQFRAAFAMIDKIVMATVIQPRLLPVPAPDEERLDGAAYIDWVIEEDKNVVMDFAFKGARELERFRGELGQSDDGVDAVKDLESAP